MRIALSHALAGWVLIHAFGCGSSNDSTGRAVGMSGSNAPADALSVFPPKVYTGFDGTNTYRAPIIVHPPQTSAITWTIGDASIVSITTVGSSATLTAKRAGDTTITVSAGGKSASAPLKVYAYTKAQYDAGALRYTTAADAMNPACMSCHGQGKGPDHTPTEIDADTDEEIQHSFTTGVDPEGRKIKDVSEFAALLNGYEHSWKVTEEEKIGLLAYLRALAPIGIPEYDAPTAGKN